MSQFPFSAILGADDMGLALILTAISSEVGGVLVRGEKGTAKSTMVRGLAEILPDQEVMAGCRFGCDPAHPDPTCPDLARNTGEVLFRAARLVELPVGATEDRVIGSLDLRKALGGQGAEFEPGLLAEANRGILYVDEVNLLHDHLVDLLLDAAAMGRNTVERDGISVSHAARIVLVGTMNPEEGELRPQLLDRFGLTVEVAASRDPELRAEIVRRRLAYDLDPAGFCARYADQQEALRARIAHARDLVGRVRLPDRELERISRVCAGFEVDGMRADIVTARAAKAHAAWFDRDTVTRADVRAAARLALPHRRRRNPFDAPGLDEDLLDQLLGDDDPEDDPPTPEPENPEGPDEDGPDTPPENPGPPDSPGDPNPEPPPSETPAPPEPEPERPDDKHPQEPELPAPAPRGTARPATPFVARNLEVRGLGAGRAGRRSRAITDHGRTIGATTRDLRRVHLPATLTAAARNRGRHPYPGPLRLSTEDLRGAITQGRESNLVVFAVDTSGSMGARQRMSEVKTAVLSLLLDAYRKRDRVAVVTFRGHSSELALPATTSVEAAERCLADLPHGGRTPLAEGLMRVARTIELERIRDPRRRALVVLLTDGRATSGPNAVARAREIADQWGTVGADVVVVDCESGRFRMGLARDLAVRMGARYLPLPEVAAEALVTAVGHTTATNGRAA
ncbi:VWA domain-containing protein [Enemella sp. A6]|uniref:VWA domain-containing protein n=1 Tax=Enemella sp. A6 TaxID=3440152 RepID=UPI003EBDEDD2